MDINDLETGDILLFDESPYSCCLCMLDNLIKTCTNSVYSHSAIVLKNPPWIQNKPGLYIWESTYHGHPDPQDNIIKFGVQTTPITQYLQDYPGTVRIYVRKCYASQLWTDEKLLQIHTQVYGKTYDILPQDWFEALIQVDLFEPRTNTFFCSALVAYILVKVGMITSDTNWTKVSPRQLSVEGDNIKWIHDYGPDRKLKTK